MQGSAVTSVITYRIIRRTTTAAMMAYRTAPPIPPPPSEPLLAEDVVGGVAVGEEVTGGNVGAYVGEFDVGAIVGCAVGANVGIAVGVAVGADVGAYEGRKVGDVVGTAVGAAVPQAEVRVNGPVVVPKPSTATKYVPAGLPDPPDAGLNARYEPLPPGHALFPSWLEASMVVPVLSNTRRREVYEVPVHVLNRMGMVVLGVATIR